MNWNKIASQGRDLNIADFAIARMAGILALLLAGLSCMLVSCASTDSTSKKYTSAQHYPPTNPEGVQVLRREPAQSHERLGEIVVDAPMEPAPETSQLEEKVRKEAAKLGADAAVIVVDQVQPEGVMITGGYFTRTAETLNGRKIVAVAIKFRS
jgi:hypothetical protein